MKYCSKCGQEIHDEAIICVHCSCETGHINANRDVYRSTYTQTELGVISQLSSYEKTSGIVWIIIAVIQLIIGIYFWWILIMGVWNIFAGISRINTSNSIMKTPVGVYESFNKSLASIIIFMILNICIGGIVGVVGCIFDFVARNYAVNNGDLLLSAEAKALNEV